jgi:methionyl-tRNA formyltransferase
VSRARTVFFGSGGFGRESLQRLHGHDEVELVGVVTAPPRPAGRKGQLKPTAIDEAARDLRVPTILTPERLRAPESIAAVLALRPDLAVLADYGQIVPRPTFELRHGALNLHPSLLPRHRGATPIQAAILAGDTESGVTLFRMDEGLDTGPIVAQRTEALTGTETADRLEEALATTAAALLDEWLGPWVRADVEARPQPSEGATLTRPLRRSDGWLDPRRPATELERQVRAYQPWPGSHLETEAGRLTVWVAEVAPGEGRDGQVERIGLLDGPGLRLVTAEGDLVLREVQPAGGKRMSAAALVRGRPGWLGSRVAPLTVG